MTSTNRRREASFFGARGARWSLGIGLVSWLSIVGCGGSGSDSSGGGGSASTGGSGIGGDGIGGSGGVTSGGFDENSACATSATEGKTLPVTMLIMFDKSGSMLEGQKWAGAKAALIAFFQDPKSAGLSVGLRFFPDNAPSSGCDDQGCSIDACAAPLVAPAPLLEAPAASDPQQQALVDAVNSKSPAGETPMYPALGGAEKWAAGAADETSHRTAVVLVTDGEPTTCNTDIGAIAALAKDAKDAHGVLTYAIGMPGSNASQLDQIAAAGGTDKAFLAGAGEVSSKLILALTSIQKAQIACTFDVPAASQAGDVVDPGKVNVNYYSSADSYVTMPRVDGLAQCTGTYGWYYDDPATPKTITLCPSTCETVQGNASAVIKILLGCETILK